MAEGPDHIRRALAAARLYLVTPPQDERWLAAVVDAGVDVVQLRDKHAEAALVLQEAGPFVEVTRPRGVPFVLNDRPDVAFALRSDGVHLGQDDLPPEVARTILGPGPIVGRSTHTPAQVDAALRERDEGLVDYIAVGPVHETPTKPGRKAVGLDLVRYAAAHADLPWFAIGGIDHQTVSGVVEAGARRIVVVRAVTQAPDPVAAVRALLAGLPTSP